MQNDCADICLGKLNIFPGNFIISSLKAEKYKKQNVRFFQKHPLNSFCESINKLLMSDES